MYVWLKYAIYAFDFAALAYFVALNSVYILLTVLSFFAIRRYLRRVGYAGYDYLFANPVTPPLSVLVPAHNEEVGIAVSVRNILHLRYPRYEVIVVNDGSTDNTLATLIREFRLIPLKNPTPIGIKTKPVKTIYWSLDYPSLRVVDKENGGKADALNAGIGLARYDYFVSMDADALLEMDALLRIMRPVVESGGEVVAVGGIVRVANGCRIEKGRVTGPVLSPRLLPVLQTLEYLRAFLAGRSGLSVLNSNLIISGAFGLFRKDVALRVGGYDTGTVGEDMELVLAFHDHLRRTGRPYRIVFIGEPVCWTEVPETFRVLSAQRRRWQRGMMQVLTSYRHMLFNPKHGWIGLVFHPFFYFLEGWGALLEVLGYAAFFVGLAFGVVDKTFAAAFLAATVLLGICLSLGALLLEEVTYRRYSRWGDLLKLGLIAVAENFGYRQFTAFLRFRGVLDFLTGKEGWGKMERRGLGA